MKDCYTCVYLNGAGYCSRTACTYLSEIDLVPVIRCKDCIYHHGRWCTKNSRYEFDLNDVVTGDDDYCSYAERKVEQRWI